MMIDRGRTFGSDVKETCFKAEETYAQHQGAQTKNGKVMAQVANSVLLYGAPILSGAMRIGRHRGEAGKSPQIIGSVRIARFPERHPK
ncbi:hypothetical protein NQ315_002809 [Exocentrus adspersus]|uniref:DNA-directed RNA polymerase n=1 Tax=Exocentrus adspersus TaxID=1586481 RepID=A0AAV8VJM5_9CUCU|nr:hypothetical protein NQ315_002809 [Exocentrus adspersus]